MSKQDAAHQQLMFGATDFREIPMKTSMILSLSLLACLMASCMSQQGMRSDIQLKPVTLPQSVQLPSDGSTPITANTPGPRGSRSISFTRVGQREFVKTGESVNLVYEGIEPETTYLRYESVDEGYNLELAPLNDPVAVQFEKICQTFIVASPMTTTVQVVPELRYEQIVWTPRADGTWEVRVGTVERGCRSEALDRLNRLRSTDYERSMPRGSGAKRNR
jgi:hypothetical protein